MERAIQQTQLRYTSPISGKKTVQKFTIASISNVEIIDRASRLGVSLGKNVDEALQTVEKN
jgi:uncharacterized protein YunC (DUF1805 family)